MRETKIWSRLLPLFVILGLIATACGATAVEEAAPATEAAEEAVLVEEAVAELQAESAETETAADTTEVEQEAEVEELPGASEEENQAALAAEIEAVFTAWQEDAGIPGASLSVRLPGQEPIAFGAGVSDIISGEEVTPDDYFRIGSITKPMTAALVLQLVDEGLLELDETVDTYLPGWLDGHEFASEITVRQLMNHTNGLIEYAFDPGFYTLVSNRLDQPLESEELFDFLATREPLFEPGTAYSYETGGFFTLGDVIETVTGNSAAEEMRARIFEPAGADNIYLAPQEQPPESVVNGYGRDLLYVAGTALIGRQDSDGLTVDNSVRDADPVIDTLGQPQEFLRSAGWTGGGAEAQLESVSAVFKALFDGTVLSNSQIDEMTTTVFDANYGLGLSVDEIDGVLVYSHGGGVPGFRSQANYLPDLDITWAVSANLIPLPDDADVSQLRADLLPILVETAG